jgi:hypothetical protein
MVVASRRIAEATWMSPDGPVLAFLRERAGGHTIAWEIFFPVLVAREAL